MSPEIVALIIESITDIFKILGPAIIASWATYKAASVQINIKLKELDKVHSFNAREHLFNYYRERQDKLSKSYEEMQKSLGFFLGKAAAAGMSSEDILHVQMINKLVELHSKIIPSGIESILKDMKKNKLENTDEFKNLQSSKEKLSTLKNAKTQNEAEDNMLKLLEITGYQQSCNEMIIQKNLDEVFIKYVS